eukprot:6195374-Pleurochrysis_carterae.AAC.1
MASPCSSAPARPVRPPRLASKRVLAFPPAARDPLRTHPSLEASSSAAASAPLGKRAARCPSRLDCVNATAAHALVAAAHPPRVAWARHGANSVSGASYAPSLLDEFGKLSHSAARFAWSVRQVGLPRKVSSRAAYRAVQRATRAVSDELGHGAVLCVLRERR